MPTNVRKEIDAKKRSRNADAYKKSQRYTSRKCKATPETMSSLQVQLQQLSRFRNEDQKEIRRLRDHIETVAKDTNEPTDDGAREDGPAHEEASKNSGSSSAQAEQRTEHDRCATPRANRQQGDLSSTAVEISPTESPSRP